MSNLRKNSSEKKWNMNDSKVFSSSNNIKPILKEKERKYETNMLGIR